MNIPNIPLPRGMNYRKYIRHVSPGAVYSTKFNARCSKKNSLGFITSAFGLRLSSTEYSIQQMCKTFSQQFLFLFGDLHLHNDLQSTFAPLLSQGRRLYNLVKGMFN
ncbi:unnamed protein product [Ectocarpus sp. 6 AP-2014]